MNGLYQWAVCFVAADGTKSALSEWSEIVQIAGSKAVLTSIPISGDAECAYREVYRRGGTLGDEARYAFTIWDNTSTIAVDMYKDYELGGLVGEEIPTGTIRSPKGKIFGPVFKGRLTMYQVTGQEDCLFFSNSGYGHAWDELKVVGFGSRIMGAWVDDDILYVSTKNGIKKIVDDLYAVSLDPGLIQETGVSMSVLSPWGFAKKDDNMLIATRDGVSEFNGYQSQILSDKVKDFFEDVHTQTDYTALLYSDNHLFLYHANATPDTFECYLGMGKNAWRELDESFCTMCLFDAPGDSGEVCAGTPNGLVYTLDRLNGGPGVNSWMTSKDFSADDPFMDLILDEAHIITYATMPDSYLIVHFRANQADVTGATKTIEPGGVYGIIKIYLSGNEFTVVKGATVGIDIEGTDSLMWRVKAIKLIGRAAPRTTEEEVL